jgi:hypothetical protein
MGIEAFAVDLGGNRLRTRERIGSVHPELVDAEQQRVFASAARALCKHVDRLDADFDVGALCVTANALAANHLLWSVTPIGAKACSEDGVYSPERIAVVHEALDSVGPGAVPSSVDWTLSRLIREPHALLHARTFIACCAKLGLGIAISP